MSNLSIPNPKVRSIIGLLKEDLPKRHILRQEKNVGVVVKGNFTDFKKE